MVKSITRAHKKGFKSDSLNMIRKDLTVGGFLTIGLEKSAGGRRISPLSVLPLLVVPAAFFSHLSGSTAARCCSLPPTFLCFSFSPMEKNGITLQPTVVITHKSVHMRGEPEEPVWQPSCRRRGCVQGPTFAFLSWQARLQFVGLMLL